MKNIIYRQSIAFLTIIILLNSCNIKENVNAINEKTVITGKILDYDSSKTKITIINKNLCVNELREVLEIDSLGNFYFSFISNSKRDVRIKSNRANFLVLIYPGDSVFVEFKSRNKEYWKHIKFSGDRATENKHIIEFQKTFLDQSVSYKMINKQKKVLDEKKFVEFMDSV